MERFELPRAEAIAPDAGKGRALQGRADPRSARGRGDFLLSSGRLSCDLCAGPHLASTGKVKAFKLTSLAGAYWRGSEKNKMLQRVYGTAFYDKAEMEAYLQQQEEARKRDHNKLGRELEYFTTVDCIGQGLPILLPKGARVVQLLQRWVEDVEQTRGCQLTKTPYYCQARAV